MRKNLTALMIAAAFTATTIGCTTLNTDNQKRVDEKKEALEALLPPLKAPIANAEPTTPGLDIKLLPADKQLQIERNWLRMKRITYTPRCKNGACTPTPIGELLKEFRQSGINIMSSLPLDGYTYSGNGVKDVDAETALDLILGSMGLDFDADERGQYVTIIPMKSKTWTLNLGNRTSGFTASSFADSCPSMSSNNSAQNTGSAAGGGGQQSGQAQPQQPTSGATGTGGVSQQSGTTGQATGTRNGMQTINGPWAALDTELAKRMTILVPNNQPATGLATGSPGSGPNVPGLSNPGMAYAGANAAPQNTSGSTYFRRETIGSHSLNPETGAITIQAPGWLLRQLDKYMIDVIAMYNTSLTFDGTIVNVRANTDRNEGFDLAALASAAGKYGFYLNNNILGGISLSSNNNIPTASTGNASTLPGGNATFGLVSPKDNLQVFNAFLSTIGGAEVINRPIVTVTSGVPVEFGRLTPIYTNEPTQQLAAGNVNANAISTIQNNIIEHRYGSLLRIMPTYDPKTRRVRAVVNLLQRPLVGYQPLPLAILDAKGNIQSQVVRKPQIECSMTSTEAILDDGELIVIGGQIENIADNNHSGVTGAMDVKALDWFTSQRRETASRATMYFALRVRLTEKPVR